MSAALDTFVWSLGVDDSDDLTGLLVEVNYVGDNERSYHGRLHSVVAEDTAMAWVTMIDEGTSQQIVVPWHSLAAIMLRDEPE